MKSIIVFHSYHHNNTRKIAEVISNIIGSDIKSTFEVNEKQLSEYNLIGFGSGIDSGRHYKELLDFADNLSTVDKKECFIFSTSAIQGETKVKKDHTKLRKILELKGFDVVDEFSCKGFNTNSFLKYIGGMNKNRPNEEDLNNAEKFASTLNELSGIN